MDSSKNEPNAEAAQRILLFARRYFLEHGFRSVTMDDLARELGMSKKTLYQHFASKRELLTAVIGAKIAEARADLAALSDGNFVDCLHGTLDCVRRHTAELSPAFLRDLGRDNPELLNFVMDRRREMIRGHWRGLLERGRKENMIRRDISLEVVMAVLTASADAVVNPSAVEALGMTLREAFGQIVTLIIEGAATEKGRMQL